MNNIRTKERSNQALPSVFSHFTSTKTARRKFILFIILITPVFLLRITTAAYPILQTIYLSFTNLNLLRNTSDFIGLQNYPLVAGDFGVRGALSFTIMLVTGATVLELFFGMIIALLLNASFRGRGFARTINLIPWAIPTIVAGYAFRWLLDDQFGLIPYWVTQLTGTPMTVFISPVSARITVILAHVWKDAPFMAMVFLAGMQGVPLEIYDAARVDGANFWQQFWHITVPFILPLTITMGLFRLVWSLGSFDLVLGLTQGGPGTATSVLALQIFREGIMFFKFGFASAISVVLLFLVGITGMIGLWLFKKSDLAN